ncbi:putative uncharacterized protein [Clostridium sp. CAG:448]|nr:putative uncharacterized protein [Clostridium sp. CAG:448]
MYESNDMKEKLRAYLDLTFAGAPAGKEAEEFKEELYADMCDKYDDLVDSGMSEGEAYNRVISGIGTPDELFEELNRKSQPNQADIERAAKVRRKANLLTSLAIALYILSPVPVMLASAFSDSDRVSILGACMLFLIVAAATFLIVYASSMRSQFKGREKSAPSVKAKEKENERSPLRKAVGSAIWIVIVAVYLCVSFWTSAWHLTWLIFPIGAAINNIIDAAIALKGGK